MKVHQLFTNNSYRNFTYILEYDKNKAICIDPYYSEQVEKCLEENNLELFAIINTHEHYDHIAGNKNLVNDTQCEVWAHENAKGKIPNVDRFLRKRERIELDKSSYLEVMDTPGHTFAHLCLKLVDCSKEIAIFSGDTLFNAGVGNCQHGGDSEVLYETLIEQFSKLADFVKIYPGHDYLENNLAFTKKYEKNNEYVDFMLERYKEAIETGEYLVSDMGMEREVNLFFRLKENSVRAITMTSDDKATFLKLRELRDKW